MEWQHRPAGSTWHVTVESGSTGCVNYTRNIIPNCPTHRLPMEQITDEYGGDTGHLYFPHGDTHAFETWGTIEMDISLR